jgi:uncharacterized membrane protein YccC
MTYLERRQYRHMRERAERLREALEEREPEEGITRDEALELLDLVAGTLERMSPDRWDHMLEVVAEEASRRAGRHSAPHTG